MYCAQTASNSHVVHLACVCVRPNAICPLLTRTAIQSMLYAPHVVHTTAQLGCNAVPQGAPAAAAAPGAISAAGFTDLPVSQIKKVTAARLLESKQTIPHYYLTMECQMDALLALRAQVNESLAASGTKLSVNDFIIKAAALVSAAGAACLGHALLPGWLLAAAQLASCAAACCDVHAACSLLQVLLDCTACNLTYHAGSGQTAAHAIHACSTAVMLALGMVSLHHAGGLHGTHGDACSSCSPY